MPLVLVRTPTYRRPEQLTRAMRSLQAQTHEDWICEIRDDCQDNSARAVVEDLADPRIRYVPNRPQKFLCRNMDDSFRSANPYKADYFCVLEDDNVLRPGYMARGREIIEQEGVQICQLTQVTEHDTRTPHARIDDVGIFDNLFDERIYQPRELRLAMFGAIGISNGALFWSRNARSDLSVDVDTIPTLEEYLRAYLVIEPIYICRDQLAVWAKNEEITNRNLGLDKKRIRRELDMKASVRALRRKVWEGTPPAMRDSFLSGGVLRSPVESRLDALWRAGLIPAKMTGHHQGLKKRVKLMAVSRIGAVHPSVGAVVERCAA